MISGAEKICGVDVGSTTVKYVLWAEGQVLDRAYKRHNTRQAAQVLEFFSAIEQGFDFTPGFDLVFFTGSGAGKLAELVGGKIYQEVVAVGASVEKLHPDVRFVSEIGGEDMKTICFNVAGESRSRQVLMQSACSGGTGTFIEKTARKLSVTPECLPSMRYTGYTLHKLSSKCGIFAEADANTLVKAGVPNEEIIASLFEAVVFQNLATLTKGNTPMPQVLLLGGPNLFFKGLQEAWIYHLGKLWHERGVDLPQGKAARDLILVPEDALYYAALGCVELGRGEPKGLGVYQGTDRLRWWVGTGQHQEKGSSGRQGLCRDSADLEAFKNEFGRVRSKENGATGDQVIVGCDFGSTSAKAVCLNPRGEVTASCYTLSKGNPIEDAKALFTRIGEMACGAEISALALTGYGKDLLGDLLGADVAVVETIAHATAGLRFFPDADCICDVGGTDVKIMLLRQGAVTDFRLNSQCSSGNGAFLQGVAERFGIPLEELSDRAFNARAMPQLSMGCGVFLQSDIVNQLRKGWQSEEILAALCSILPLNVWIYAGGMTTFRNVARKFILQGGTHQNLAVVKAQVDFLRSKVPDADIVVHPYPGEAGAIGAGLIALDAWKKGATTRFRGYQAIASMTYKTTTSLDTVCRWCPVECQRTFVDVALPGAGGRAWSRVPVPEGYERVIVNNACPKGLVEDVNELRLIKATMEAMKNAFPNVADFVRKDAFHRLAV